MCVCLTMVYRMSHKCIKLVEHWFDYVYIDSFEKNNLNRLSHSVGFFFYINRVSQFKQFCVQKCEVHSRKSTSDLKKIPLMISGSGPSFLKLDHPLGASQWFELLSGVPYRDNRCFQVLRSL